MLLYFKRLLIRLAYPMKEGGVVASAGKFLLVFAPTQVSLAINVEFRGSDDVYSEIVEDIQ